MWLGDLSVSSAAARKSRVPIIFPTEQVTSNKHTQSNPLPRRTDIRSRFFRRPGGHRCGPASCSSGRDHRRRHHPSTFSRYDQSVLQVGAFGSGASLLRRQRRRFGAVCERLRDGSAPTCELIMNDGRSLWYRQANMPRLLAIVQATPTDVAMSILNTDFQTGDEEQMAGGTNQAQAFHTFYQSRRGMLQGQSDGQKGVNMVIQEQGQNVGAFQALWRHTMILTERTFLNYSR